ncbi:MAG: dienelactone hydrolase family protein [Acidobacteria bacterium]|nr:dienelactone hydrolase family protein [Acidobacteriota bacterium]
MIDRRDFLERLYASAAAVVAGGSFERIDWTAVSRSTAAADRFAVAGLAVKFPAPGATLEGYLAKPAGSGPHPAVILHGPSGLDEAVRDAARDYAREGFVALAVDPLSRRGGTASFASPEAARRAFATLDGSQLQADLDAAFHYLHSHPSVLKARIGVTDFTKDGQHRANLPT